MNCGGGALGAVQIGQPSSSLEPYVARYRLVPVVLFVPASLTLGALYVNMWVTTLGGAEAIFVRVIAALVAVMVLAVGVSSLVVLATGRVAVRVDAEGVTLGRVPCPPLFPVTVPWRDIEAIVCPERWRTFHRSRAIALRLRADAAPAPGRLEEQWARLWLEPAGRRRAVRGWRLDEERFAAAVRRYGGHVEIVRSP